MKNNNNFKLPTDYPFLLSQCSFCEIKTSTQLPRDFDWLPSYDITDSIAAISNCRHISLEYG